MCSKEEHRFSTTPEHGSNNSLQVPIQLSPSEVLPQQSSPATVDSLPHAEPVQESWDIQEKFVGSTMGRNKGEVKNGEESKRHEERVVSSFLEIVRSRQSIKDTSKADSGKESFKHLLYETSDVSAFRLIKNNQERIEYLRNKISQVQKTPQTMKPNPHSPENPAPFSSKEIRNRLGCTNFKVKSEMTPTAYSIIKISNVKVQAKRESPEPSQLSPQDNDMEKYRNGDVFQCVHCSKCFKTGQALGGHMSRKHSGKSVKYNYKKKIRQRREFERMKLYIAKKKFFSSLGYDYEEMMQTPDGKMKAKSLINRSKIKRIKSHLTEEEVSSYFKS